MGIGFRKSRHTKRKHLTKGKKLLTRKKKKWVRLIKNKKRSRKRKRHTKGKHFDKALKRVIAQHRRYQIARGDKRFKTVKKLVKYSRPNKTKRKNRIYYRKRRK